MAVSRFVVFSLQTFILLLVSLPIYASHRHHMLHKIAFLHEIRYACVVPIAEMYLIDVEPCNQLPSCVCKVFVSLGERRR